MDRPITPPFRFTDPRQERIYKRLSLIGEGPAAFYRDACRLRSDDGHGLEATSHLVAHLLREVESAIRHVLEPFPRSTGSHKKSIKAVLHVLEIDELSQIAQDWLALTEDGHHLSRKAHRAALQAPRLFDAAFAEYLLLVDAVFDGILEVFEHKYFIDIFRTLDELLSRTHPSSFEVNRLLNHVPHNLVTLGYFLDRLMHPDWLEKLHAEDFFARPPAPEWSFDNDGVRYPSWPQARCLASMAASGIDPQLIARIINSIPETDNPQVQNDLIEAIRWLPIDIATPFLPRVEHWIELANRTGLSYIVSEHLAPLVVVLAEGGRAEDALHLAEVTLSVRPVESVLTTETVAGNAKSISMTSGKPVTRVDEHDYEEFVGKIRSSLINANPDATFALLCGLLDKAIVAAKSPGKLTPPEDSLDTWRPSIERQQNLRFGIGSVIDVLISAIRDAGEEICRSNPTDRLPTVLAILRMHNWRVFQRLECHFVRIFAHSAPSYVWEVISNRAMFDRDVLPREYQRLMHDTYTLLSSDAQQILLSWIEAGPDSAVFETREVRRADAPPSPEDIDRHTRLWQWRHLRPLRDVLPDRLRVRLAQLDAEFHESAYPEPEDVFSPDSAFWVGPTSPLSAGELAAMEVGEIVKYIQSWKPTGARRAPSHVGFARTLGEVVKEDPERFAAGAMAFASTGPMFVGWLLFGLGEALKIGKTFQWSAVLWLCRVSAATDGEQLSIDLEDGESGLTWMPSQICRLLCKGFVERPGEIPINLRGAAWAPLEVLHTDSDPTPEWEDTFLPGTDSLFELATSTVRGEALEAVICYAIWLARHGKQKTTDGGRMSDMPEVQEVLNHHLEQSKEPSLVVRSIYGSRLNQLVYLDRDWVQRAQALLFPAHRLRREAVWQTFLVWGRVDLETYSVLREQYLRAVNQLEERETFETEQNRPSLHGLVEHLLVLYWWGEIGLNDSDQLLPVFFTNAPVSARAHGISFLGRSMMPDEVHPEEMVLQRLRDLWDWRLESCRTEADGAALTELKEFGWWFSAAKFDSAFAIDRLRKVLELSKCVTPISMVARKLVNYCTSFPAEVVSCFDFMLDCEDANRGYIRWLDEARECLALALASDDEEARRIARRVVNRIVARGYIRFRTLID